MKKFLIIIIIFFVACGSNSEETLPTTTTTLNPDLRNLNITVYDDTVNDEYELVKVKITYPDKYTWTPDLEYGSDSIPISRFEIGQIGKFSLFYDSEKNEVPIIESVSFFEIDKQVSIVSPLISCAGAHSPHPYSPSSEITFKNI